MSWKEVSSVLATVCASTPSWSMRASTDNYGGRPMTAFLRMCLRFKVRSQRRLPTNCKPSFHQVKGCNRASSDGRHHGLRPLHSRQKSSSYDELQQQRGSEFAKGGRSA